MFHICEKMARVVPTRKKKAPPCLVRDTNMETLESNMRGLMGESMDTSNDKKEETPEVEKIKKRQQEIQRRLDALKHQHPVTWTVIKTLYIFFYHF